MSTEAAPEDLFADLVDRFAHTEGVATPRQAKGRSAFGSAALKVDGKIFAMSVGGNLVLKLPRERVASLIAAGAGLPFDAGKGRPMKEWVAVGPDRRDSWEALSREALTFVRGAVR